jgi:hypothetical protein
MHTASKFNRKAATHSLLLIRFIVTAFFCSTPCEKNINVYVGTALVFRVARFFLAQHTKKGKYMHTQRPQNIPNGHNIHEMAVKIPMTIKYTNIVRSKALKMYQHCMDFWYAKMLSVNPAGMYLPSIRKNVFVASVSHSHL